MTDQKKFIWNLIVLVSLTFVVYSFAINGAFKTMDDEYSIVRNDLIRSFHNLPKIFSTSFFTGNSYYRPLVSVSFMKDYFFFKLNPVPYYIENIFLHIINALLVFCIVKQLTRCRNTALSVAFLFALHPIQWEAVSNIPGRAIVLCTLFSFASFLCFIQPGDKKRFVYSSLIFFALALLCKESAGVLPIIILSYVYFLKEGSRSWGKMIMTLIPFGAVAFGYVLLRHVLGITHMYPWRGTTEHVLGFLTFLRSVITDFRILFFPIDLYFDRSQVIYTNFTNPGVALTFLFFLTLVLTLWKFRAKIPPLQAFWISWFGIGLLPVSQIVTTVGVQPGYISTADHFLYAPCLGAFALIVWAARRFQDDNRSKKWLSPPVVQFALVGYLVFLVLLSIQYNIYSSNETAMFERTLSINPTNTRIRNSLALSYARKNYFKLAEVNFRKVLDLEPFNDRARVGLGKALCDQGKFWEGIAEYEKVHEPGSMQDLAIDNRKITLQNLLPRYQKVIRGNPGNARAYYSMGVVYSKLGQPANALPEYLKAVELDDQFKDASYNLAATYESLGARDQAIIWYQRVVQMNSVETPDELQRRAAQRIADLAQRKVEPGQILVP